MKNIFTKISILSTAVLAPSFALAACSTNPGTLQNVVCQITDIAAAYVMPILTTTAFVFFLWRIIKFIQESANSTKQTENRQSLLWSVLALTIMVSIWGIVAVLGNTLGIDTGFIPQVKPPLTKSGWTGYTGGGTNTNTGGTVGGSGDPFGTGAGNDPFGTGARVQ